MDRIQWRWTAAPLRFLGGIHGSVVVFFPLLILTGLSRWTFLALAIYVAFLVYCSVRRLSPGEMLRFWNNKYIARGQWPAN